MSQVLAEICPNNPIGVLSGPNLAKEIAQRELAATVIACADAELRRAIQTALKLRLFPRIRVQRFVMASSLVVRLKISTPL